MNEVKLMLDEKGEGRFYMEENGEQIGEMVIGITGNQLTVYHTEVALKAEGKGLAKKLFTAMVDYTRSHQLKIKALCPFALAQLKRHPADYADIWSEQ